MPNKPAFAPRGVRRSRVGSRRLARMAGQAGQESRGSGPAGDGSLALEFAQGQSFSPRQCATLVETFGERLLFKSGSAFGVTLAAETATPLLRDARNLLQVTYFSNTMDVPSGPS